MTSALVVDLAHYRNAVQAARFLASTHGQFPVIDCIHAEVTPTGDAVVAVLTTRALTGIETRCMPVSVNHIGLDIRVGCCRRQHFAR